MLNNQRHVTFYQNYQGHISSVRIARGNFPPSSNQGQYYWVHVAKGILLWGISVISLKIFLCIYFYYRAGHLQLVALLSFPTMIRLNSSVSSSTISWGMLHARLTEIASSLNFGRNHCGNWTFGVTKLLVCTNNIRWCQQMSSDPTVTVLRKLLEKVKTTKVSPTE